MRVQGSGPRRSCSQGCARPGGATSTLGIVVVIPHIHGDRGGYSGIEDTTRTLH